MNFYYFSTSSNEAVSVSEQFLPEGRESGREVCGRHRLHAVPEVHSEVRLLMAPPPTFPRKRLTAFFSTQLRLPQRRGGPPQRGQQQQRGERPRPPLHPSGDRRGELEQQVSQDGAKVQDRLRPEGGCGCSSSQHGLFVWRSDSSSDRALVSRVTWRSWCV